MPGAHVWLNGTRAVPQGSTQVQNFCSKALPKYTPLFAEMLNPPFKFKEQGHLKLTFKNKLQR
jgi:hypothetical protein